MLEETNKETKFEDMKRYEEPNPLNLDAITLARRKTEVNLAMKDYPNVSRKMIEDAWDYIHIVGEEQIRKNINEGYYDKVEKKDRVVSGSFNTIDIIQPKNNNIDI